MKTIRLAKGKWEFDEADRLGPTGGFGDVFRGRGPDGEIAVKRLKLSAGAAAFRELKIGEILGERTLNYVVPILDCGQDPDDDRYYLVMPICLESLQHKLELKSALNLNELCAIVNSIVNGLIEVKDIFHRDLKPGNVLFFNDHWCLADFGIAKFVEDSTSFQTLRQCLTPPYAAPEQWRGERPTHATDVYSLGCIVYEMASGQLVFKGSLDDIREAHLSRQAEPLKHSNARLVAFVSQMLRKSSEARPTLERCLSVFSDLPTTSSSNIASEISEAAKHVAAVAAAADAARQVVTSRREARKRLTDEAEVELKQIKSRLFGEIQLIADEVKFDNDVIYFGQGMLGFYPIARIEGNAEGQPNLNNCGWDVCAYCEIYVQRESIAVSKIDYQLGVQYQQSDQGYKWSATLVYAKIPSDQSYRWREISFWAFGISRKDLPFYLPAHDRDFDIALSNIVGRAAAAFGPVPIDGEDEVEFRRRWSILLGRAAVGKLTRPSQLPVPPSYFV